MCGSWRAESRKRSRTNKTIVANRRKRSNQYKQTRRVYTHWPMSTAVAVAMAMPMAMAMAVATAAAMARATAMAPAAMAISFKLIFVVILSVFGISVKSDQLLRVLLSCSKSVRKVRSHHAP